jgi:hypothetical protein
MIRQARDGLSKLLVVVAIAGPGRCSLARRAGLPVAPE